MEWSRLNFRQVVRQDELEAVSQFWTEQFRDAAPYLSERESEQTWLAFSRVFAGFADDQVVAACRLSPFHPQLGWEASADLDASMLGRFDKSSCAQLNRVAVRQVARNGQLHERLFYELARTLARDMAFGSFFSIVREPLVRLYKPYGIRPVIDAPIVLASRADQRYMLVEGDVIQTYQLLSTTLGIENAEAKAPVPA